MTEYLTKLLSTLKSERQFIDYQINSRVANYSFLDQSHLMWELVHMQNSFDELQRDIGRVIKTLNNKEFDASTEI